MGTMIPWVLLAGLFAAQDQELVSLKPAKDGTQTMNGLVSPLDQAGKNFYLQKRRRSHRGSARR